VLGTEEGWTGAEGVSCIDVGSTTTTVVLGRLILVVVGVVVIVAVETRVTVVVIKQEAGKTPDCIRSKKLAVANAESARRAVAIK
jgi:hypothetical protein